MIPNVCFITFGFGILASKLLAIYLTIKVKRRLSNIQRLILMGINFTQVQIIALVNLRIAPGIFSLEIGDTSALDIYISIVPMSLHEIAVFIFMANRFCEIYLNLRYNQVWTYRRLKITVCLVCVLQITVFLIFVFYPKSYNSVQKIYSAYIFPTIDLLLLVLIIIANGYIGCHLYRHHQVRRRTLPMQHNVGLSLNQISTYSIHQNSKLAFRSFLVPCLIVANFAVFFLIPGLINGWVFIKEQKYKLDRIHLVLLFYIGFAFDFLIYTFLTPPIRRRLVYIFSKKKKQRQLRQ